MTKKQLVDNYLSKNFEKVEMWRNSKNFSWREVTEDLGDKSIDGEYIRSRYKWFRKKGGEFINHMYRDWETDRKSTRLNSSHSGESRMPSSA